MHRILTISILTALILTGCGSNSIGKRIDFMAGHPGDPDLPESALGATDLVLEASDPVELRDLLYDGLRYARRKARRKPRYLFALGRVAQVLEYDDLADSCFTVAAKNGSAAAHAYLGFRDFYEKEDIDAAVSQFEIAIAGGFVDAELKKAYEACNFDAEAYGFNRADLVSAFYKNDLNSLDTLDLAEFYVRYVNSYMWQNDMLYFTEDKALLLDLDHNLKPTTYKFYLYHNHADLVQDARRMGRLYDENRSAFKKMYEGMVIYWNKSN